MCNTNMSGNSIGSLQIDMSSGKRVLWYILRNFEDAVKDVVVHLIK